jgi:uncharacterized membrane protein (DUF373 family)
MKSRFDGILGISRGEWSAMTLYQRFEQLVSWTLTTLIAVIIAFALVRLTVMVFEVFILGAHNPLDHRDFENIFGRIMTLLIALEFNHSILQALERRHRIVQVKTVVLISILSLVRKFIVLDVMTTSAVVMCAMALAVLALGIVYRLIQEPENGRP